MKNILVIGATGQIGSELTLELRKRYGDDHVVAGYIPSAMPKGELKASGPSAIADVTDRQSIEVVARQFSLSFRLCSHRIMKNSFRQQKTHTICLSSLSHVSLPAVF